MKKKNLDQIQITAPQQQEQHTPVPVHCRVLIVSEGTKTEPNYFKSFHMMQHGGIVFEIESQGEGVNTIQVVEKAIQLRGHAESMDKPYDSVWAVFDKDNFADVQFNEAIEMAQRNGINAAWSNEAFELWYVLHFCYRNTPMSRTEYQGDITTRVNAANYPRRAYQYCKNATDSHAIMSQYGDEATAIRDAERLHKTYTDHRYATHNPCTTVYQLVRLLRGEDPAFNAQIIATI